MTRVLLTGANGFVAKALAGPLIESGFEVRGSLHSAAGDSDKISCYVVGDINAETMWREALLGVDVVVHLAARVHVMRETAADPLAAFRDVNVKGTENLALQCAAQGVKRLIFLSTVKVNGERTESFFSAENPANPQDPYAQSKWEAEQALRKIGAETGLEIVIIRPPLVYGPGVKGNFLRLLAWVYSGFPIPLASVNNARSMVGVDNLCDFIKTCIEHPKAKDETFLVADSHDLSTPALIRLMAGSMRRPVWLLPVPVAWLLRLGALCGRKAEVERLCGSLAVNTRKAHVTLGWRPPFSVEAGVGKTVAWFMAQKH